MLRLYILFIFSLTYSINPPKEGGAIPRDYIDIFKSQNIIYNDKSFFVNDLRRDAFVKPQSPPSNFKLLVLLVGFSDNDSGTEIISKEEFQDHLFGDENSGPETGSLSDYYTEISYGKFNLTGDVFGWYESSYTEADALNNTSGFIISVLGQVDNDVNFSDYDSDNDGVVDGLLVVFPGLGADEDGSDSGHIWPHMSTLWDNGSPYSGIYDGVSLSKYAVCPEQRKVGNSSARLIRPIGVFAHEFGHILGLPDLYERSYGEEAAVSEGIGEWCLMASGSWNGTDGDIPAHMSAWCKHMLGWSDPIELNSINYESFLNQDGELELQNVAENDGQIYKIYADSYQWNEYFLMENRQLVDFDSELNGPGLLLYHIDENQYFGMGAFWGGLNNDDYLHKLVDVEEADGLSHLDSSVNRGDDGDPYPGSSGNTSFNDLSYPNNYNYGGLSSSVEFANISSLNGAISMNVFVPDRDGQVLVYDSGITTAYGYSDILDHSYAVEFTAPDNGYLTKIDLGLYYNNCNLDVEIYRSKTLVSGTSDKYYFSDHPSNKLFENSYSNMSSGWSVVDIAEQESLLYFDSGETFYIVVTNKEVSYGWTTDLNPLEQSYSYIRQGENGDYQKMDFGNLCLRARFDTDGALNNSYQEIPDRIAVKDAYPNPFNPAVNLSYLVSTPDILSVKIFDLKGSLVEELIHSYHLPGEYNLQWAPSTISSGIYFVEYSVSSETYNQKITFIK